MDFSTEYVMMCAKASELQELAKSREVTEKDFFAKKEGEEPVWLPRFDQMQDLIVDMRMGGEQNDKSEDHGRTDVGIFFEDVHDSFVKNGDTFTLEQAAICLLMKEVYFKKWNVVTKEWEEK